MICKDCRTAGNLARAVLRSPDTRPRALISVMQGHGKCKGGTWCDCKHQTPSEGKGRG